MWRNEASRSSQDVFAFTDAIKRRDYDNLEIQLLEITKLKY